LPWNVAIWEILGLRPADAFELLLLLLSLSEVLRYACVLESLEQDALNVGTELQRFVMPAKRICQDSETFSSERGC
jgi:hypothetical protein